MKTPTNMLCILCFALIFNVSGFHFIAPRLCRSKNTFSLSDTDSVTPPKFHQVYIGNLPVDISESDVTSLIREKAGESFKALRLAKDLKTGAFRGFCYIDFEQKGDAEAAVAALSGTKMDGTALKVDLAMPRTSNARTERPPKENSCFIGNLDFSVSEGELMELCNERLGNGVATKVRLATDRETGTRLRT